MHSVHMNVCSHYYERVFCCVPAKMNHLLSSVTLSNIDLCHQMQLNNMQTAHHTCYLCNYCTLQKCDMQSIHCYNDNAVFLPYSLRMDHSSRTETESETTVFSPKPAETDHKRKFGKCNSTNNGSI